MLTPQYKITAHQAVTRYKGSGNENKFVPDLVKETVDTYIVRVYGETVGILECEETSEQG